MQETQVLPLGQENRLEEEMTTHSSILCWEILWTEEPGGLQSMGLQRVRHDLATEHSHTHACAHTHTHTHYFALAANLLHVIIGFSYESLHFHIL